MQINQYPNTATSVTDADWLDLDKSDGISGFQSQKLSLPVLGYSLQTFYPSWARNLYDANGQLTGNRTLDANSFTLGFANLKEFVAEATVAPSGGAGSFEFIGYGSTGADLTHVLSTGAGDAMLVYGDLYKEFYGASNFVNNSAPSSGVSFDFFGYGTFGGSEIIAKFRGYSGASIVSIENQSVNISQPVGIGVAASGFYSLNTVGAIQSGGNITAGGTILGFNGFAQFVHDGGFGLESRFAGGHKWGTNSTIHMSMSSSGQLNINSLPTSSAGLSSGDIWNDSGTLKIV